MNIPDPIELMESRIERQIDLVDGDGKYPCCYCGERFLVEDLVAVSPHPDSAGMCQDCAED